MEKKIWIGSDHAGFDLKEFLKTYLETRSYVIEDMGTHAPQSVHYPIYGFAVAKAIVENTNAEQRLRPCGILVCGSGVGVSIAANRVRGIRAVLALREDVARLSREHNASNVLCLGARLLDGEEARRIVDAWLVSDFEGGRHEDRVNLLDEIPDSGV